MRLVTALAALSLAAGLAGCKDQVTYIQGLQDVYCYPDGTCMLEAKKGSGTVSQTYPDYVNYTFHADVPKSQPMWAKLTLRDYPAKADLEIHVHGSDDVHQAY